MTMVTESLRTSSNHYYYIYYVNDQILNSDFLWCTQIELMYSINHLSLSNL